MNCTDDNSIIITIAVEVHGIVTNVNLPPEISNIFRDVRWFSKAGDYSVSVSNRMYDEILNTRLNRIFTKDLTGPTIDVINNYIELEKPEYKSYLSPMKLPVMDPHFNTPLLEEKNIENICRIFGNITVDKIFTSKSSDEGIINCLGEMIFGDISGVFLISIHRKISASKYRLIYPRSPSHKLNMNLFDIPNIETLSIFFGTYQNISNNIIPELKRMSTPLENKKTYIKMENDVKKQTTLSEEQKAIEISRIRSEYYNLLNDWKIEIEKNKITGVKMSEFIKLIKQVCGNQKIYINLLDYSCNPTTPYLPKEQEQYKKYLIPSDIESLPEKNLGGKRRNKIRRKKSISKRRRSKFKKRNTIKNRRYKR